ncbi:hypothetical protein CryarDRAFT_2796 [Cryptosporangium arvum DSM 44712]|uniref:Uncharacterized protein n=1 Tax=Cryptosporangium arvum DSM 44712 TaxID=927661 RepID=A0A010ZWS7_9ACTN|nr:hypothetical protein CryarDRAFT_2796 [Cryptosporangium arvum DSM 44712]
MPWVAAGYVAVVFVCAASEAAGTFLVDRIYLAVLLFPVSLVLSNVLGVLTFVFSVAGRPGVGVGIVVGYTGAAVLNVWLWRAVRRAYVRSKEVPAGVPPSYPPPSYPPPSYPPPLYPPPSYPSPSYPSAVPPPVSPSVAPSVASVDSPSGAPAEPPVASLDGPSQYGPPQYVPPSARRLWVLGALGLAPHIVSIVLYGIQLHQMPDHGIKAEVQATLLLSWTFFLYSMVGCGLVALSRRTRLQAGAVAGGSVLGFLAALVAGSIA